jgi:hypothetical protein
MQRIKTFLLLLFVTGALAGCSYSVERTVTSTAYTPPEETVTTTTYPAYVPPMTSQVVTTVTRNPDGTVTRTSRYFPPTPSAYYSTDNVTLASEVRSMMRKDPLVSAHARNIGVGSYADVVEITGKADSISTVQQASWDALQVPGVIQVNNDMMIDPTSPG